MRSPKALLPALALPALLLTQTASAAPPAETPTAKGVNVVVVRIGGTGSAASAQRYIDAVVDVAAKVNAWVGGGHAKYFTSIKLAKAWIGANEPHYGILSLVAYLGMRSEHKLSLLGTVTANAAGGQQYFVISKNHYDLAGCKGQTLASNLAGDAKFVDKVVSGEAFDLADFTLVETRRPVQTIKAVIDGEAECALIDDAQEVELASIEGGDALNTVWFSPAFPSMVIARFPTASDEEAKSFQANLAKVCEGDEGNKACSAAGIKELHSTDAGALDDLIAQYDG